MWDIICRERLADLDEGDDIVCQIKVAASTETRVSRSENSEHCLQTETLTLAFSKTWSLATKPWWWAILLCQCSLVPRTSWFEAQLSIVFTCCLLWSSLSLKWESENHSWILEEKKWLCYPNKCGTKCQVQMSHDWFQICTLPLDFRDLMWHYGWTRSLFTLLLAYLILDRTWCYSCIQDIK